jgi:DNA-binding protein YbaB
LSVDSTPIPIRRAKKLPRLKNSYEDRHTLEDLLAGFITSIVEKLSDIEKYSLQAQTDNLSPDSLREEMKQLQDQISSLKKKLTEIELKG